MRFLTFATALFTLFCLSPPSFAGWTNPVFIDSSDNLLTHGIEARNDSIFVTYGSDPGRFVRSLDGGLTWQDEFVNAEGLGWDMFKLQGDTLAFFFGAGQNIQFYFSTNLGATWEEPRNCGVYSFLDSPWPDFSSSLVTICSAEYLYEVTTIFLKHSTDFGITWAEPESIWTYPRPVNPFLGYFYDRPYILSSDFDLMNNHSLIKLLFTVDDGESWISYDSISAPGANWEQRMDASPGGQMAIVYMDWFSQMTDESSVLVCLSSDSGMTWTPPVDLSVADVNRYPRVAVSGDTVIAAWQGNVDTTDQYSSVLLRRTYDFGQTWQPVEVLSEPGLGGLHPTIELVNGKIHLLCFGRYGGVPGLYYRRWEPETGIEEEIEKPAHISLLTAFPNPFNASTTISYGLPEASDVCIEIYNILGQHVETVFEGGKPAGNHVITWDASAFPSGVYFACLNTLKSSQNIKMVLLK